MNATSYIEQLLHAFVAEKEYAWPDKANVEPPRDKRFGDLATNLAMMLTKQARTKPRDIAESIKAYLEEHGDHIQAVDIAGPGFINVTLSPDFWQAVLGDIHQQGGDYGRTSSQADRKIQVEYVSANPTGPLHIGHGRGAAVGDSLARILRYAGADVSTEYYINDAGRQMRLLGLAVWTRLQQSQGRDIPLPEDCYKGDYIKDIAQKALEQGGQDLLAMDEEAAIDFCRRIAMNDILDGIKADLATFGAEHQVWFSEQSLFDSGSVEATLKRLQDTGLAFEQDGALWFRSTDYGDDKDRVLRKSDGLLTYFASDIAYHDNKYQRGFDLVVNIWGADHHGYIPRMKAAVQALGKEPDQLHVILVQLVNLLQGGEQIAMSTRAGKFETLADVCADVGADASRFIFLSRKSDSKLDFDLELVKQKTMDNPVYYVQYAHARIKSMQRKAVEQGISIPDLDGSTPVDPELPALLNTEEDMLLLKLLARFPEAVDTAAESLSPHHVSYYLQELAGALHRYYTVNPVLVADNEKLIQARMLIMAATARVLTNGLALLGVTAPDRM